MTSIHRVESLRHLAEKLEQLQDGKVPCDRQFVSECLDADAHPDAWDVTGIQLFEFQQKVVAEALRADRAIGTRAFKKVGLSEDPSS